MTPSPAASSRAQFVLGTGYYRENDRSEDFYKRYWLPNTLQAHPTRVVVTTSATPLPSDSYPVHTIDLPVNPQCGRRLKRDVAFSGWALGFIHGAVFAYSCGADYIYKEQDCLCFGPWVERIYQQADRQDKHMLTGELYDFPRAGYLEQCLVFLRYEFIMPFLGALLSIRTGESKMKPEQKFSAVMAKHPKACGFFAFGCGGNRPYDAAADVFFIQRPRWDYKRRNIIKTPIGSLIPDAELADLTKQGLLP